MKNALKRLVEKKNISLDIDSLVEEYVEVELEVEQEKYREVMALALRRLFSKYGVVLTPSEENIFSENLPAWPPFPETREVLLELKKRGYKLVILSNIDEDLIRYSIALMGVEFESVITAEQTRSYKPTHSHWERMLRTFNVPKEQVLHITASYVHDIIPAKQLGFTTAWINRRNWKQRGEVKPDYEFTDLRPLLTIL